MTKEKFYFRISSNLLSVIILNYTFKNSCEIEVIAGGGKYGLLSFSWGAEDSMRDLIIGFLKELWSSKSWSCTEAT
jgi:hypothetical protein